MILDTYKYEAEGVKLEFSFPRGERNLEQKKGFIKLLMEAIEELKNEVE